MHFDINDALPFSQFQQFNFSHSYKKCSSVQIIFKKIKNKQANTTKNDNYSNLIEIFSFLSLFFLQFRIQTLLE